jgi:transposase-like protein
VSNAHAAFQDLKEKWRKSYTREIASWENDFDVLLTFLHYPPSIQSLIYTTNMVERTIKEFKKRLKPMNSSHSLESAEKIVYMICDDYNQRWSSRRLRGFSMCSDTLESMFEDRYKIN